MEVAQEHGPWDGSSLFGGDAPAKIHEPTAGEITLDFVAASFSVPVRYLHDVGLTMSDGDVPDSVVMSTAEGVMVSVCVLAEPLDDRRWCSGLAADTATAVRGEFEPDAGYTVGLTDGVFGREVVVTDAAGVIRLIKIGVDGPRWTALVTCHGPAVTDEDREAVIRVLETMTVYRGRAACAPDAPLSMQLVSRTEAGD
ncbi:MAG: DUF3710 domain-containing protein [Corynebacterium provencense]|uniref:DUF3710 domain-containing protein n=1 Tax=Corynebacterium provencense TaxID=1737425 RepID=UPI0025FEA462|nr:DUF3710 domain-containing protein [uncultured Corynebacterium sp.]MCI1257082.1 DUF3710 domain-containing protein [Corynebacterium provencense]